MFYSLSQLTGLPGLPAADRELRKLAETWESRPRLGRGGGVEYSLESLPKPTQQSLKLRELLNEFPFLIEEEYHGGEFPDRGVLFEAKLWVLQTLERFCGHHSIHITYGRDLFVKAFNNSLFTIPARVKSLIDACSVGTLKRWAIKYRRDLQTLQPQYKGRVSIIDRVTELKTTILSLMTCSANQIHRELKAKLKHLELIPPPRTIAHWLQHWKQNNPLIHAKSTLTKSEFNHKFRRAVGRRDEKAKWCNSHWEMDSTKTDIMLADGKRYNIVGVIDIFSRRCKFHVSETSNSGAIIHGLLRKTIKEWGCPDTVITDQGKDFCSINFGAAIQAIGGVQHICNAASGWEKPFIERLFGTMNRDLMKNLPGWIGANITERPDQVLPSITPQGLQERLDFWAEERYYQRPHSTLRQTPQEKWDSCQHPIKRIDSDRVLDLLLAPLPSNHGVRTIAQKGVSIDGHWYSPADSTHDFWSRQSEQVNVKYDAAGDAGFVLIYDRYGKFICEADCPELTGVSRIERVQKMKEIKRTEKVIQKQLTHLCEIDPTTDIQAIVSKVHDSIPAAGYHIDQAHVALEQIIDIIPISSTIVPTEPKPESIHEIYLRYRQEFHTGNRLEDPETINSIHHYEQQEINWYNVSQADLLYIIPPSCRRSRSYEYLEELTRAIPPLTRWHHPSNQWRTIERQLHLGLPLDPHLTTDLNPGILNTLIRCQATPPYQPTLLWTGCDAWLAKHQPTESTFIIHNS